MTIKQLRLLRKQGGKKKAMANCVAQYQLEGKIKTYFVDGYVAYDEDEYKAYKATVKKGRPLRQCSKRVIGVISENE